MKIKMTKSVINYILDMLHKKDLIIAGRKGTVKLKHDNGKTFMSLYYAYQKEQEAIFYFVENLNYIGFMYKDCAPKEFIEHSSKTYETHHKKVIWFNKFDLCLAMIDIIETIRE